MTLSETKVNLYRSPNDIHMLMEVLIDSYFASRSTNIGQKQQIIMDKLNSLEINIPTQLMNILESPLNKADFKDLVDQLIRPMIFELIEKAHLENILTKSESELMNLVISTD